MILAPHCDYHHRPLSSSNPLSHLFHYLNPHSLNTIFTLLNLSLFDTPSLFHHIIFPLPLFLKSATAYDGRNGWDAQNSIALRWAFLCSFLLPCWVIRARFERNQMKFQVGFLGLIKLKKMKPMSFFKDFGERILVVWCLANFLQSPTTNISHWLLIWC